MVSSDKASESKIDKGILYWGIADENGCCNIILRSTLFLFLLRSLRCFVSFSISQVKKYRIKLLGGEMCHNGVI